MTGTITAISCKDGTVTVKFNLSNFSTVTSGLRPPLVPVVSGYSDFYQKAFTPAFDPAFQARAMSQINENMSWSETFSYTNPQPPSN